MISSNMQLSRQIPGFALIELSIAFLVIGILSVSTFALVRTFYRRYCEQITTQNQQMILHAIGRYTSQHGCLPYPCNPKRINEGYQNNPPPNDEWHQVQYVGVVPWKTLSIPKKTILDGNGKLMTYAMHPLLGCRADVLQLTGSQHLEAKNTKVFKEEVVDLSKSHSQQSTSRPVSHFCLVKPLDSSNLKWENKPIEFNTQKGVSVKIQPNIDAVTQGFRNFILIQSWNNKDFHDTLRMQANTQDYRTCFPHYHIIQGKTEKSVLHTGYICDTIAVVLISHGSGGGEFNQEGERTNIKNTSNIRLFNNAANAKPFQSPGAQYIAPNNLCYHISGGRDVDFDQIVSYVTRFNLNLYSGPRCENVPSYSYPRSTSVHWGWS